MRADGEGREQGSEGWEGSREDSGSGLVGRSGEAAAIFGAKRSEAVFGAAAER